MDMLSALPLEMDAMPLPRPARLWRSKADFFRPFRSAANDEVVSATTSLVSLQKVAQRDDADNEDLDLDRLNAALHVMINVFPDVEPEVFRKMLMNVSEESRVELVTEQILRRKTGSARGKVDKEVPQSARSKDTESTKERKRGVLPIEETFRGEKYHQAARQMLYLEFGSLSHSTIKSVMSEHNHSYTTSRATLQQLAGKSWRFSLSSLWNRRAMPMQTVDHPALLWQTKSVPAAETIPAIKKTCSAQLDRELHDMFVRPIVEKHEHERLISDRALATQVNEAEAADVGALFDCECCFSAVAFEQIAMCDEGQHFLCYDCIRRTTNEAIYGQGWARSADINKSTVRCFAPAIQECQGSLPALFVERALKADETTEHVWSEFQKRATSEALIKSRVSLQSCPFCTYAELDEIPSPRLRNLPQIIGRAIDRSSPELQSATVSILGLVFCLALPALLLCLIVLLLFCFVPSLTRVIRPSWTRVYKRRRGLKFGCRDPSCKKVSCTRCLAEWYDPHVCFESEKQSLRTAVEASATAVIKRTCPRCMLSFIKSSGCNKLVCNCGYTMCYVCRAEITNSEGYSHFCQHFRPNGGRCGDCEKCDLYGDEDEEVMIRRAAEAAEREWRETEGSKAESGDVEGNAKVAKMMVEALVGQGRRGKRHEELMDAAIDVIMA